MSNENLATLRESINPEAGVEESLETAGQEIQNEIQREKGQVKELGKALPDDPEAQAATQTTLVELDEVRERYSKQLDSVVNPEEHEATLREPAKVFDLQDEKTLRENRTTLRMAYGIEKPKPMSMVPDTSEIDKGFEAKLVSIQPETSVIDKSLEEVAPTPITLREERRSRRTEHGMKAASEVPTLKEPEEMEVMESELEDIKTIKEEAPPTLETDAPPPITLKEPPGEEITRAALEGLKELSGDEWSDLYQQSEFAWTPEIWENLSNQAPANDVSEREQLRQLAINKAEMGLSLAANALALKKLADLELSVPGGHSLFLEKRKLEQGLAQDKAKEKQLFETAREKSESIEVDVSEFAAAKINKPSSGYTDEELERIAREKSPQKQGPVDGASSAVWKGSKTMVYGAVALGLAGGAKIAGYVLSGKAAFKVLDWIDRGMEKIQKYAFTNDLNGVLNIAKNTGDAIHKKMDNIAAAKGDKKKEE